jgi:hypothetical protein
MRKSKMTAVAITLLISMVAIGPANAQDPIGPLPSNQVSGLRPVQLPLNPDEIALRSGEIDVRSAAKSNLLGAQELLADSGYYLVHFVERPDQDTASEFIQTISRENILHYIPYSSYLCRLDASHMEALRAIEEIDWIGLWEPKYKISPTVYEADADQPANEFVVTLFAGEDASAHAAQIEALGGVVRSYTQDRLHVHIDAAKVPQIAGLNGIYWIERRYPMMPANDNGTWIVQTNHLGGRKVFNHGLTGSGQVIAIADTGVDADHLMFWDSVQGLSNHNYNAAQRKILRYYNWYQTGILTGTVPNQYYDPGDGYYPGVADPMYNVYDWDINQGHGSHVAGTALGEWVTGMTLPTGGTATAGYDSYEGNAYGAKLVFQDLVRSDSSQTYPPPDLNDPTPAGTLHSVPYPGSVGLFPQAMSDGAYIHLDPWTSAGGFGAYTSYSQDVDEMMWTNRNFLVIFPTGDDGPGTTTLTPPSTAKNCLSVGAAGTTNDGYWHSTENVASFSGWGPTGGWGRIKPDVCAPGQVISSTLNNDVTDGTSPNDGLVIMQGTSMAAATVAGASALVRQYYGTGSYDPSVVTSTGFQGAGAFTPSAAMMKATIINSAQPMNGSNTGGTIPGDGQGWGRVVLDSTLYFAGGDTRWLLVDDNTTGLDGAAIVQPFFKAYTVVVAPGQPLVVDVAYTDPPGTAGSAFQMVNYLYVEVDHPNGVTYYLSGAGNFSNGQSVPNTAFIYPDTVQKVRINNPDPGLYTIYVVAFQTDQVTPGWNVQPYALVVSGNLVQSQGYVQFDQEFYEPTDALNQTLADADLAGSGTVNVTLTSAATGDTETTTLNEINTPSGVFRGTFPNASGIASPGNGTLEVASPDTVTVTYNEASPAGVRTDTAWISRRTFVYLPIVLKSYVPPVVAPDLVVNDIIATSSAVTVTIRNQGNASVPDNAAYEFWVDLYVNPSHVPGYNETCQTMGCEGAAWGVTSSATALPTLLPIAPGEVVTLTTSGDYYWWPKETINWPLSQGDTVYAQVDSVNAATTYGAVLENHEMTGGPYNNVSGQFTVQSLGTASSPGLSPDEGQQQDLSQTSLPPRP